MNLPPPKRISIHVKLAMDYFSSRSQGVYFYTIKIILRLLNIKTIHFCIHAWMSFFITQSRNKSTDNFCLVLQYTLMIGGEELTRLTRDYIKYLFGAKPSVRLTHSMEKWHKFYKRIARKGIVREDWLERKIVATPTW